MCIHETIQLSQDGERVIVCGDCGREFGQLARDEKETFVAYATVEHPVIVVGGPDSTHGIAFSDHGTGIPMMEGVNACASCGFAMACDEDEGGCHS